MSALNSEGLEKARAAIMGNPFNDEQLGRIISAYLSALPPVDGLEVAGWQYRFEMWNGDWSGWTWVGIEKPTVPEDLEVRSLVTLSQASSVIAGLKEEVERLTKERGAAIQHSKSCARRIRNQRTQLKWLQPPDRLKRHAHLPGYRIGLHVTKLHELWRRDADRADTAEARVSSLEEENKRLRDVLSGSLEALQAAEERDDRARFRANSPRMDAVVVHLRTSAIRSARQALEDHNG
jgi:hypothetical protein